VERKIKLKGVRKGIIKQKGIRKLKGMPTKNK